MFSMTRCLQSVFCCFIFLCFSFNSPVWGESRSKTVDTPVITPNGGTFAQPIKVGLKTTTHGAKIHYTVDGTIPTKDSWEYKKPFFLNSSKPVKAKAFKKGLEPSKVAGAKFIIERSKDCGNGICEQEKGETVNSCPVDCKIIDPPPPVCGDRVCEAAEAVDICPQCIIGNGCPPCYSCPEDCHRTPICGDGICELSENSQTCPRDCHPIPTCGNKICEVGENVDICPQCIGDPCLPCDSCPKDCEPTPVCGNRICEVGEMKTCLEDCEVKQGIGSFYGRVTEKTSDGTLKPIVGATIFAEPAHRILEGSGAFLPEPSYETKTNDQGYYDLRVDTDSGGVLFRVVASKEGYNPESETKVIRANEKQELNFSLEKIIVKPPRCGNGVCEADEEARFCPQCIGDQCPPCGCPQDCR